MRARLFTGPASGAFRAPGIFNPAAMAVEIETPQRVDKKPGGSDVGHVVVYNDRNVIVKAGVSLSLLGQAAEKVVAGRPDKVKMYLGFIVGNYLRITKQEDQAQLKESLILAMLTKFNEYMATPEGQQLQQTIKQFPEVHNDNKFSVEDVYNIARFMMNGNPEIRDVIALSTFADVVSGAHSQEFNNAFQLTQGMDVAKHAIFVTPDAQLQASYFLPEALPLDAFLLDSFRSQLPEGQSEIWLDLCRADLKERLKTVSLKGLCSSILIRHIMGESADNGPDNMVLMPTGVVNVDVTGFRYSRELLHPKFKTLGWADTLINTDVDKLLEQLFDATVFKTRYITDEPAFKGLNKAEGFKIPKLNADKSNEAEVEAAKAEEKRLKAEFTQFCNGIHNAIVAELKLVVRNYVVNEVSALRAWAANMNTDLVVSSMQASMEALHGKLHPSMQFSSNLVSTLAHYNAEFLTRFVAVAKENNMELASSAAMSM